MEDVMTYKNLLFVADTSAASDARLVMASDLARRHGAHLSVVIPAIEPDYMYYNMEAILADAYEQDCKRIHAQAEAKAAAISVRLTTEAIAHDIRVVRSPYGQTMEILAGAGLAHDFAIVAKSAGDAGPLLADQIIEAMLFGAGRPVLVTPSDWSGGFTPAKAMIAWKPGPEAARAVQAAIPLLQAAGQVEIAMATPEKWDVGDPGADIARHLSRHGISANLRVIDPAGASVGHALRMYAAEYGASLIVMGAYGHSRLRELVFGGVSRDMLTAATVPVFMAR
jgi:nucleotide-binding universal stress UspA family protein